MERLIVGGLLLLSSLAHIALGVVSIKKGKEYIYFAFFVFSVSATHFFQIFVDLWIDPLFTVPSIHLAWVFAVLLNLFFLLFALQKTKSIPTNKYIHAALYFLPALLILFFLSGWGISEINFAGEEATWKTGPTQIVFSLYASTYAILGITMLLRSFFDSSGIVEKTQLKYIIIGSILCYVSVLTLTIIFPIFGINRFSSYGLIITIIFLVFIYYAIVNTRFLDIKITFQNTLAKVTSFIVSVVVIGTALVGVIRLLVRESGPVMSAGIAVAVALTAIFYGPLYRVFRPFFLRVFSPKDFNAKERLTEMRNWALMTQKPTMQEVYEKMKKELCSYLGLDNGVRMYLYDFKEQRYYLVYPRLDYKKVFIASDTCVSYELEKCPNVTLVSDELKYLAGKNDDKRERYEKLIEELRGLKAKVLVPVHLGADMIGIITLGKKRRGKPYSTQDIRFVEDLAEASAGTLVNAMMRTGWEEMQKAQK